MTALPASAQSPTTPGAGARSTQQTSVPGTSQPPASSGQQLITRIVWGPGATASVKQKLAAGARLSSIPTSQGWTCDFQVYQTRLSGGVNGDLEATADQSCTGDYGSQRIFGRFQRSSWSGWRTYSNFVPGSLTTGSYISTTFSVSCGGSGQGTYDYRLDAYPYAGGTYGPDGYGAKGRFACGT
jgi:hypothetical protein